MTTTYPLDFTPALKCIESWAKASGLFTAGTSLYEPKNAPGKGFFLAMWLEEIAPVPSESGQNVTTGRVAFTLRVYVPMLSKPEERIDQDMGKVVGALMGWLSGDIDLQDNIKYVDLLGATGTPLGAKGGYVTIDTTMFRIMDVVCPLVINDIWLQGV